MITRTASGSCVRSSVIRVIPHEHRRQQITGPSSLFRANEQGVWYDPSDIKLNWRRNLLTYSEQFDNVFWKKNNSSITANAAIAPDGTTTADKLIKSAVAGNFDDLYFDNITYNSYVVFSIYAKMGEHRYIYLRPSSIQQYVIVDLQTMLAVRDGNSGGLILLSLTPIDSSWCRISVIKRSEAVTGRVNIASSNTIVADYANIPAGDGTSGIYVWGAQLEKGTSATEYQKITDGVSDYYTYQPLPVLYQDAAGTIPVTAVEQPVGLMLDKSGRGNHAYQATSANRPTLSARYNLLKYSEDFSNAVWNKGGCGVSTNSTTAPDGLQTADKITENTSTGTHEISSFIFASANIPLNLKVFIKRSSGTRNIRLTVYTGADGFRAFINIDTLSVTNESFGAATYISGSVTHVGDGWYLCSITGSTPNVNPSFGFSMVNTGGSTLYTGDGTSGIYIWGADLRPSNHGTDLPPYQRVTADTDYDTVGFPPYLAFNGTSSSMVTNSIDFSATDKMSVWAGVRRLSSSLSIAIELSTGNQSGSFYIADPYDSTKDLAFNTRSNTLYSAYSADSLSNPDTECISVSFNLIGVNISDRIKPRVDGSQPTLTEMVVGASEAGNYGNYPLYIGARNQSQYFFNGNIYSLIIRGAQSTDKQVSNAESWINKKIGKVY